jgi:hypothetical protein
MSVICILGISPNRVLTRWRQGEHLAGGAVRRRSRRSSTSSSQRSRVAGRQLTAGREHDTGGGGSCRGWWRQHGRGESSGTSVLGLGDAGSELPPDVLAPSSFTTTVSAWHFGLRAAAWSLASLDPSRPAQFGRRPTHSAYLGRPSMWGTRRRRGRPDRAVARTRQGPAVRGRGGGTTLWPQIRYGRWLESTGDHGAAMVAQIDFFRFLLPVPNRIVSSPRRIEPA